MPGLDAIYDAAFFAQWGKANEDYVRTCGVVARAVAEEFEPRRLADLGCGAGAYAHAFAALGVEVFALDGVRAPAEHAFSAPVHLQDLTAPFENVWGAFDLALCLEVAEHIPEALCGVFLDNLARFSDTIVLSAAPPFQGGHHHVNEQPKRYWAARMAERGFIYDRKRTGRLYEVFRAERPPYMWMAHHISVYGRSFDPADRKRKLPFSVRLA